MNAAFQRALLVYLAATAAMTGLWAYVAPWHWYENFPGMGLSWLPQLGPYNEHLSKDVGALFIALLVLTLATLLHVRNPTLLRITASAWVAFNLLHSIYHLSMLHMYDTTDAWLSSAMLTLTLLVSVALFIPARVSSGVAESAVLAPARRHG